MQNNMILNNPKWKTNHIASTAKSDLLLLWFFAIFWNALNIFVIVFARDKMLAAFADNPIFYVFLSFPLIGIFILYKVIKDTFAWNHFGKTPLVLKTFPGQLGGQVNGYLELPRNYNASQQAKVSLTCLRHYIDKNRGESESTTEVKWQDTVTLRTESSINGSRVNFSFTPPVDLPDSKPKGQESIEWNIHIKLEPFDNPSQNHRIRDNKKNKAFSRKFIIPVLSTTVENRQAASAITASIKDVRTTRNVIPADSSIPKITTTLDGTEYYFPPLRNKTAGLFIAGFGIALVVISWLMLSNFRSFIPLTSTILSILVALIAIVLILLGVFFLNNSLTTRVNPQGIKTHYKIFGLIFKGNTEIKDIADIIVKSGMTSTNGETSQVWYDIRIVHANGSETTIGDNLEGSSYAETIRQKIITNLGSWKATEYLKNKSENKLDFIQEKIERHKKLSLPVKALRKVTPLMIPAALLYDGKDFIMSFLNNFL